MLSGVVEKRRDDESDDESLSKDLWCGFEISAARERPKADVVVETAAVAET